MPVARMPRKPWSARNPASTSGKVSSGGAGAVVGCRRCQDVCPVGEDYETLLKDALDEIPEDTPEKQARLSEMKDTASEPDTYSQQSRWIGTLE